MSPGDEAFLVRFDLRCMGLLLSGTGNEGLHGVGGTFPFYVSGDDGLTLVFEARGELPLPTEK